MERRILHIDLDAFFVSVEQALDPSLKGKPVVVGGRPDRRGVISAASYEARKFGLHSGMPLSAAVRLCPDAIFITGNFQKYREFSKRFMAILGDFSPDIEPISLDEAFLDVTGFDSLYGSYRQMAEDIRARVRRELHITASVGIAGNKITAKVASDEAKPDGICDVPPGEEAAFLAPLAIEKLPGIGKKSSQVLRGIGIHTIGEFARMSCSSVKSRLGTMGDWLQSCAKGIDTRRVEPPGEAKSISRETTFAEDISDESMLQATLRYLSEKVGADLRRRNRRAWCVTVKVRYADFTTITRRQTLQQPMGTDNVLFKTGSALLSTALAATRQSVRLLGIGVTHLTEPGLQLAMMDNTPLKDENLDKAFDRIREKYGFSAIQTGRTLKLRDIPK